MVSLPERLRNLRALALEHLPGSPQAESALLYCDRCLFSVDPRKLSEAALAEWGSGPEGDLCPRCVLDS